MNAQVKIWLEAVKVRWLILGAILYLGSAFLMAQILISPQSNRYYGAVDKQLEIDETYVNLIGLDIEAAVQNINNQLEELDSLEANFERRLLKSQRINSIFPIIDRACTQNLLKVVTLEPVNRSEMVGSHYEKHLLRLTVLGKFSDFLNFLSNMESHDEWVLIEWLSVEPLESGTFARFNLVLSVLTVKEQAKS